VPVPQVPIGIFVCVQPLETQYAIMLIIASDKVIGVPSKYLHFPDLSLGSMGTVTLKRARRVRPQRTKKERKRWSRGVRIPIAKATAAGDTPKDNWEWSEYYTKQANWDGGEFHTKEDCI
jgi:hypothetical protein